MSVISPTSAAAMKHTTVTILKLPMIYACNDLFH